ncbi:MAG TPA: nitrate reductase molybdenum cofactor assembly chaperone [Aquificales bacterium]|nr:nitrate reductase molybdenum cofactor assembly chaperone [Aquificales bacterium]
MEEKLLFKVLSLLLDYPEGEFWELVKQKEELVKELPLGDKLKPFLDWVEGKSERLLKEFYVATFDFSTKYTLYLTYHRYGDERERGEVLAKLKEVYLKEGLTPDRELPDYLPLILEFASLEHTEKGREILTEYLKEVEKVHKNLKEDGNPYAHLFEVLLDTLRSGEPTLSKVPQDK